MREGCSPGDVSVFHISTGQERLFSSAADRPVGMWKTDSTLLLQRFGCLTAIGPNNVFQSKTAAITGIFQKLDKTVCQHCDARIFLECASVERVADE